MDQLINLSSSDILSTFSIWEAILSIGLAFGLALILAYVYRVTHKGTSYSQAFVHTMIVMCFTVAMIMLIIGSNIARAFSLVGALSVIRFRNAMKETRDVGFIFLAMAIGMACGTRFYLLGIVFTVLASVAIYFLFRFDIGASKGKEVLLKIHVPTALDYNEVFDDVFYRYLESSDLLSVESVREGMFNQLVYSVELKDSKVQQSFLDEIRQRNGGAKVSIILGLQGTDV